MPKRILHIIVYTVFWLLFFQTLRLFFAVYNFSKFDGIPISKILLAFPYSLRTDISAVCYIFVVIFLILILNEFLRSTILSKIIHYYTYIFIVFVALFSVADVEIYSEWGSKINSEAISLLDSPTEALASVSTSPVILLLLMIIIFSALAIFAYNHVFKLSKMFYPQTHSDRWHFRIVKLTSFYFVLFSTLVIGIRGGVQLAPMNPSFAYYSTHDILNNTSLNPTWNLGYSTFEKPDSHENYLRFTSGEVENYLSDYRQPSMVDTSSIFNFDKRPNVVLVILESYTADIIASLGGLPDVTPNLDSLIQKGLSLQNFYASGNRTYKSLPAIINGYPSLPADRIIKYRYIFKQLPSLADTFEEHDYFSSFYYGGETEFANIRALVIESGYDTLVDQRNFKSVQKNSKWGAHDHVVFERVLNDIDTYSKPFFTTILTLSNHEPFEIPTEPVFKNDDDHQRLIFKNTAAYTDQSLGDFIRAASKKEWFNNTIFVFTADHGHPYAKHRVHKKNPEMFHIPFVIYSNLLKEQYIGGKITKFTAQADIAALLFSQLGFDYSDFIWSKNVFDPAQNGYAYYGFVDGFGWLTDEHIVVYDNLSENIIYSSGSESTLSGSLETGQAYLQAIYENFISYGVVNSAAD